MKFFATRNGGGGVLLVNDPKPRDKAYTSNPAWLITGCFSGLALAGALLACGMVVNNVGTA